MMVTFFWEGWAFARCPFWICAQSVLTVRASLSASSPRSLSSAPSEEMSSWTRVATCQHTHCFSNRTFPRHQRNAVCSLSAIFSRPLPMRLIPISVLKTDARNQIVECCICCPRIHESHRYHSGNRAGFGSERVASAEGKMCCGRLKGLHHNDDDDNNNNNNEYLYNTLSLRSF